MPATLKEWFDIAVAATAIAAFLVSLVSLFFSWRATQLADRQEARRKPQLLPRLLEGHFVALPNGARSYSFKLSVRNPSDSDNAVAAIDLHVSYAVRGGVMVTAKLPASVQRSEPPQATPAFAVPSKLAAHDAIAGWCDFLVEREILSGGIESYRLVLTDSHEVQASVDVFIVREKSHVA